MSKTGPVIRTEYVDGRPAIVVRWSPESEEQTFCGDSWCTGACGLPALVSDHPDPSCKGEWKAYSSMVALGPLMQPWRVKWTGARVQIPEEHRADLFKRYWH